METNEGNNINNDDDNNIEAYKEIAEINKQDKHINIEIQEEYNKSGFGQLYNYISSLRKQQKETIIRSITESENNEFEDIDEMDIFIMNNLIAASNCKAFTDNTEKGLINWCFDKLLTDKTNKIMPGIENYLYYPCFINAISYTIKDIDLLDSIDRFINSEDGYIGNDAITSICKTFNIAIRVRHIDESRNMIEFGNKANKGWYGNPDNSKYCCEVARIESHYIPWIEDTGITEYYLNNRDEIDKYASLHKWTDNKKHHTYKRIKNNFLADEKKKGLNCLRLINKLKELGAFEPIKRDDEDYILYTKFRNLRNKQKRKK